MKSDELLWKRAVLRSGVGGKRSQRRVVLKRRGMTRQGAGATSRSHWEGVDGTRRIGKGVALGFGELAAPLFSGSWRARPPIKADALPLEGVSLFREERCHCTEKQCF